jgi:hypothetical protein
MQAERSKGKANNCIEKQRKAETMNELEKEKNKARTEWAKIKAEHDPEKRPLSYWLDVAQDDYELDFEFDQIEARR